MSDAPAAAASTAPAAKPAGAPAAAGPAAPPGHFLLDGQAVPFAAGQTILQAAALAGHAIPHLCWHPDFAPHGSCRVCSVLIHGRPGAACTVQAAQGQVVQSQTNELTAHRTSLLQMLFVEGNHFCPGCEKSGDCQLQATAYAVGMTGPHFEAFNPVRPLDASHPDVLIDFNRCILCELCVRASHEVDHKNVFAIGGHGIGTHLLVNSPSGRLGDSTLAADDRAAQVCPVGAILPKRRGFAVPIGARRFDLHPLADQTAAAAAGPPPAPDPEPTP